MVSIRSSFLTAGVFACFLSAARSGSAQSAIPDPPPAVEPVKTTITVTGTRTATELDRSPVSTSLVTREEAETRNVFEVDQILSLIEGVNGARGKGPADSDFGIGLRGFSGSTQSRTLILLDGQPLNNAYIGAVNWSLLPVSEVERVEVARGPFSSLYGGNAMGGVINLITRPSERRHLELFGQYGSMDTANYTVHATDRWFRKLGVVFGYQRYQSGGYYDQPVGKSATTGEGAIPVTGVIPWQTTTGGVSYQVGQRGREWFNQMSYRGRAEYAFSDKTFASFQYFRQSRGAGYDAYRTDLRTAQGQPVDSGLVSFVDTLGVTRLLRVAPLDFIGIPTFATGNIFQGQLLKTFGSRWNVRFMGGANQTPLQGYVVPSTGATLSSGPGTYTKQDSLAYYGNVQASWSPSARHQWIAGTEARHDQANLAVAGIPNYALRRDEGPVQSQSQGKSINESIYVQDQISVTEKLHIVAGGRWDAWKTYDGSNLRVLGSPVLNYPDHSNTSFTGKIAASYMAPGGIQLRASVGNAFRNPSIYELYRDQAFGSTLYLGNPNAKPERLRSFDVGAQRRFGSTVTIDGSYYENRIRDLLYRATDFSSDPSGSTIRLINAGMAHTRGVELAMEERPLRWLRLKQSYTYADSRITENPAVPATVGKRIPYLPDHTATFVALVERGRWFGSASGRYQSAMFSTDLNTDALKGVPGSYNPFFTADLSAGFRMTKHLTVTANAFNVLDRQYYLYYLAMGRQVFVGLRIRI
jgi:iron complex outermembrane receptor protein